MDAELVDVGTEAEDDLLRVEGFAGVVGGTVFGAAAAFDTGKGLQGHQLRDVFAGDEAEIFIAGEGRDVAEFASGEENGDRAEEEMEVLCVGNEGEEY